MKIGFLIPVYNEEKTINKLIQALPGDKKDIIVIDDGSIDRTPEIAEKAGVTLFKHKQNMGKGQAHRTGFQYAIEQGYDYLITLDGDGQHNPEEVSKFIKRIEAKGEDIIVGVRRRSLRNMPIIRYLTNLATSCVVSFLAHCTIKDTQSGYRAISTKVLRNISLTTCNFQTESEILIKAARLGYKIGEVPISTIYQEENSKIRPCLDTVRFITLALKSMWR